MEEYASRPDGRKRRRPALAVKSMLAFPEKAADSEAVAKARKEFAADLDDYNKKKTKMGNNKDAVNTAQPGQAAALSSAKGKIGDVNKAATTLLNTLKGKTGKDADLAKKVSTFANAVVPKVDQTDAPPKTPP